MSDAFFIMEKNDQIILCATRESLKKKKSKFQT